MNGRSSCSRAIVVPTVPTPRVRRLAYLAVRVVASFPHVTSQAISVPRGLDVGRHQTTTTKQRSRWAVAVKIKRPPATSLTRGYSTRCNPVFVAGCVAHTPASPETGPSPADTAPRRPRLLGAAGLGPLAHHGSDAVTLVLGAFGQRLVLTCPPLAGFGCPPRPRGRYPSGARPPADQEGDRSGVRRLPPDVRLAGPRV